MRVKHRDWRIWLGIVLTLVWISGGIWYLLSVGLGIGQGALSPDVLGSFLEGAFAPLAFLWLVLGLFMQQRELANNTEVLRHSYEQSAKQTEAIAATELSARQESFFQIANSVKHQLGGLSGMLWASGLGPAGSGRSGREEMNDYFARAANGDHEVFARQFISQEYLEEGGLEGLLYGTEIRTAHSRRFMRTFERLLQLARDCDIDGIIVDSLEESAFGLLYLRMKRHRPANPPQEIQAD